MSDKKKCDSTIARIAGNVASGLADRHRLADLDPATSQSSFVSRVELIAKQSVCIARAIVEEVIRTEPEAGT